MGLRDWLARRRRNKILKAAAREPPGISTALSRRGLNSWLPHWLAGDYSLQNSELLFSAVSRISNALSAMPVQLYKGSEPVKSDLNDLIGFAPNPNMTSCNFFKTLEACRCTSGNCYAIKVFSPSGRLERLDILDPMRCKPVMNTETNELWYRIQPEQGNEMYVHNYYILHIPFLSTNGYTGVNPVSVLYDTIAYSENIQQFSKEQLEKGVNAAVVLEAPATLGDKQKNLLIESFLKTYNETSRNILLLESGIQAKSLNLSPVDTKLFEVEKITRSKVAMVFNLPPHLLGDYSDTSYNSQEQQMLEFLMLTMLPIVTAYRQELNRKLLTKEERKAGYHFEFDMDAILRCDAQTQAEVDFKNVRSGVATPDEIRARRLMPPYKNGLGEHLFMSKDLATIENIVAAAAENNSPPNPPKPPDTGGAA